MQKFSGGRARVLIATDVASRGIDVNDVGCVINFDPPENGKAYKHRSGRTARAGLSGTVVSLVQRSQQRQYRRIQDGAGIKCKFTDPKMEILEEREFVLTPPNKSERRSNSRGSRKHNKRTRGNRKRPQSNSTYHNSRPPHGRRKGKGKRKSRSRNKLKKADSRA